MGRAIWHAIRNAKGFYIHLYRKIARWVIVSLCINLFVILVTGYIYFNAKQPDAYATNGITAPIKLTPLNSPNYSDQYLLSPDLQTEDETRVIPE